MGCTVAINGTCSRRGLCLPQRNFMNPSDIYLWDVVDSVITYLDHFNVLYLRSICETLLPKRSHSFPGCSKCLISTRPRRICTTTNDVTVACRSGGEAVTYVFYANSTCWWETNNGSRGNGFDSTAAAAPRATSYHRGLI